MTSSTADFLQRLKLFVEKESDTQRQALYAQLAYSLDERVARGWAIEGLSVLHLEKELLRMQCGTNNSRFREGDLVLLHRGDPHGEISLHMDLYLDNETELELSLVRGNPEYLKLFTDGWILDQDWFDSSPFYLSALDTAADSLRGRSIILPLLQGSLIPKIDYARYER
ncbi:MAG: hypothetical protein WCP19_07635, partial [Chloroflexota bacterium]